MVSSVGDDELGRELRDEVRRFGMDDQFIQTDDEHPTGTVSVQLDRGEPTYAITENVAWDHIAWEPQLDALAKMAGAVCFGTLAQRGRQSRDTIGCFIPNTSEDCLTVCDLNLRQHFWDDSVIEDSLRLTDWLKVNEKEAEIVARLLPPWPGTPGVGDSEYWRFRLLPAILNDRAVFVVTRGSKGCVVGDTQLTVDVPGIQIAVADTVGAGDAFTAALLTQTLEGKPLDVAARFANAYAAVVASKEGGTPTVTRGEVEAIL